MIIVSIISCGNSFSKVQFDIDQLDNNGLLGDKDGKVSLAYEFCIPRSEDAKEQVMNIDSTITFTTAPGRIKCSEVEYLCIGSTDKNYRKVLSGLNRLPFIDSIYRCYFE